MESYIQVLEWYGRKLWKCRRFDMSKYILCQVKKAELPYYIENISTNIYSIEELCFYFYNNIYLLDETIINEELCFWIRDELGLRKLAQKMYALLDTPTKIGDFILLVFKEMNYLSMEEFRKLYQQLQKISEEPLLLRQKLKGDYLMGHGKIVNAINVYQKVLHEKLEEKQDDDDHLGTQFVGEIYHNMGCAYARLFQMEEAMYCFGKAFSCLRTTVASKNYLYAVYMNKGISAFAREAAELNIDEIRTFEILEEIDQVSKEMWNTTEGQMYSKALEYKNTGNLEEYNKIMDQMLKDITKEYHHNTGY